jgi:hypothetical protein
MEIFLKPMFLTLIGKKNSLKINYDWHAFKKIKLDFIDIFLIKIESLTIIISIIGPF